MKSKLLRLNSQDFLRGFLVSVTVAVLTLLLKILQARGLHLTVEDFEAILTTAVISGIGYLLKNLSTDSDGKLIGRYRVE